MSEEKTVGYYAVLVCGPSIGWDATAMGVAVYGTDGNLMWSQFEPLEKAIQRGDWKEEWNKINVPHHLPPTWEEMKKTLERTGNAMSVIRWYEGGVMLSPDEERSQYIYDAVMGRYKDE